MKTSAGGKKIKDFLSESGISQSKLAEMIGVDRSVISNWVKGIRNPSLQSLEKISSATGQPLSFFINGSNLVTGNNNIVGSQNENQTIKRIELQKIPILGVSSATKEKFILEEKEGFLDIPKSAPKQFAVRVEGDCMVDPADPENSIYHGNYIIVDPDVEAANGDVILARIDNEFSTIKRMFIKGSVVKLIPDNPKCKTIEKPLKELEIVGKVVNVHRPIKRKKERI